MFDSLSDKLHAVFKKLRGESRLSESNIADAMREIRLALLEADVNIEVVSAFIEKVKADCVGQEVLKSVTPRTAGGAGGQRCHCRIARRRRA